MFACPLLFDRALVLPELDFVLKILLDRRGLFGDSRQVFGGQGRRLRLASDTGRRFATLDRMVVRARQRIVGLNDDRDAEAAFEVAQIGALLIEDIERDRSASAHDDVVGRALDQRILKHSQHVERDRRGRAHDARALAVSAHDRRTFENAGPDALTRHFEQTEMRDAADLDARAVILQRILDSSFDRAIVAQLFHVDEVDDDETGKVAQSQLARDLVGRLEIRAKRCVLNVVLARRTSRIDVDGDERLGLVDDDVAARLQRHLIGEHRVELGLRHRPWRRPAGCRDKAARC